ncbi:metallophosphoesterase [Cellulomonas fimi]|uniref:metallophosphoesterase family protein n=1 Tax=Cellulomonas fimi TaxID=1708 RepID=UPI00234D4A47|nr:metallophosphoesterase [Cellulomonas fimi]MDC7121025.1 metallophosphoesterase [Cellulomonas fimi]
MSTAPDETPEGTGARDAVRWARRVSPRTWRRVAVVAAGVLVALVVGVTTASVELSLGPHEARYDVTTDDTVTIDLGPVGTLQIDSPLPLTLGVRVTVQEIPAAVTELDQATTLQALNGDLRSYLAFFSAPQAALEDVARALVADALARAALTFALLTAVWWLGRWALGPARRAELAAAVRPHRRALAGGAVAVVVAGTVLTASVGQQDQPDAARPASAVFDDTPLEGASVTGRLGGVIDTYGGYVVDAYRENQAFYARAGTALDEAWDATQPVIDAQEARDPLTASPTASAGADGDEAEPVVLVVVSDLHCNVGMAPLIATVVERSDADVLLDAGDTTMNGTGVEQYCVTTFARAVPDGVELVTSPGNHDSAETSGVYARSGARVLDGSVVEVDGVRILGDHDPAQTRIGSGTAATDESPQDMAERLAQTACDDEDGVDLLLIHTPRVGTPALTDGCVPTQVSGHLHKRVGPAVVGEGVQYVSSSTAGATLGQPTVGPLNGTAEMTVLRWDPDRRRIVDYRLVQVRPDASASVSPWLRWPVPTPTPSPRGGTNHPSPM